MTDDTEKLEDRANIVLRRLETLRVKPGVDEWKVPERFQDTLRCLYGACRQQVRLAREIDTMREQGQIDVDVFYNEKAGVAEEQ